VQFGKVLFDAFGRRQRCTITFKDRTVRTTAGQLNFCHWAVSNKVLDYVREHAEEIRQDLKSQASQKKKAKQDREARGKKRKASRVFELPLKMHTGKSYRVTFNLKGRSNVLA
jgi:hypothetical protein